MKIPTHSPNGKPNGHVIIGWNVNDAPAERPDQVYHTVIAPGCVKGPHLHRVRCGRFQCVSGNVRIVTRDEQGKYGVHFSGADHDYRIVNVKPGVAAALYNDGDVDAVVMNMPTPAWSAAEPDEHEAKDWLEVECAASI